MIRQLLSVSRSISRVRLLTVVGTTALATGAAILAYRLRNKLPVILLTWDELVALKKVKPD